MQDLIPFPLSLVVLQVGHGFVVPDKFQKNVGQQKDFAQPTELIAQNGADH
jgi:hypothetical protein